MNRDTSTVFVVDDDPSVRRSLKRLVQAMGHVVETFASAEEYLCRGPREGDACLVLDQCMPGLSGLELQAVLRTERDPPPIVFLTGYGDVPTSVTAMKRGAVDFLQKPVEEEALEAAIRSALERDRATRTERRRACEIGRRLATLTRRERAVLERVIAGQINKQVAVEFGIAEKTVKVHRGRVMQKMQVGSLAELVRDCELAGVIPRGS